MTAGRAVGPAGRAAGRAAGRHRRGGRPAGVATSRSRSASGRASSSRTARPLRPRRAPAAAAARRSARCPATQLDPARSDGDICVQACADDPQVAFHAVRDLARIGRGAARAALDAARLRAHGLDDASAGRRRATCRGSRTARTTSTRATPARCAASCGSARRRAAALDARRHVPRHPADPHADRDLGPRRARRPGGDDRAVQDTRARRSARKAEHDPVDLAARRQTARP